MNKFLTWLPIFGLSFCMSAANAQVTTEEYTMLTKRFLGMLYQNPIKYGSDIAVLMKLKSEFARSIIGSTVEPGMNYSVLDNRNSLFNTSSCLADRTVNFYLDLIEAAKEQNAFAVVPGTEFPSLASQLRNDSELNSSGWVWRLAMKHSSGDPDLAMTIISVWTHDDRHIKLSLKSKNLLKKDTLNRLMAYRKALSARYSSVLDQMSLQNLLDGIVEFPPDGSVHVSSISLPKNWLVPGSLDATADIQPDLKDQIINIQAPNSGAGVLPAKYYHVYSGASAGCLLRENGLSEDVSAMVLASVAEFYRAKRMCTEVKDLFIQREFLLREMQKEGEKNLSRFIKSFARKLLAEDNCNGKQDGAGTTCFLIRGQIGNIPSLYDVRQSPEKLQKRLDSLVDRMNASELLAGSGKGFNGQSLACDSTQIYNDLQTLSRSEPNQRLCDNTMTTDECERSIGVLKTWEIDFEWTIAQQSAGAKFGAKTCKPLGKTLKVLCEELP